MSNFTPSRTGSQLRERARAPTVQELSQIPWLQALSEGERARAEDALVVSEAQAGDFICRIGRPVTYWFGLVDGLLKMSNDESLGPGIPVDYANALPYRYGFGPDEQDPTQSGLEEAAGFLEVARGLGIRLFHRLPRGVALSEEFQLVPEQSTSAIICHHPQAKYFVAK